MKTLQALLIGILALGMGAMTVGCDDTVDTNASKDGGGDVMTSDGGPPEDSSTPDANDGGPLEFTTFVKELILTQTSDKTLPTTTEDKTFVDSHDPNAFPPAFFP